MLMNLNGRERTQSAFETIFASITPKLRLHKIHRPKFGELSLLEVTLDEDSILGAANGAVNGYVNGSAQVHVDGSVNGHSNGVVNGH